jgi:hypothetical protein
MPLTVASAAVRDGIFQAPTQGQEVWRNDLGAVETYYGAYDAITNPGGRNSGGWFTNDRAGGLVPIRPTTVTIASGSGSANALGQINFTGATVVSLDGIFNSEYKNYFITINSYSTTTPGDINFQLRAGSPAGNITSGYRFGENYVLTSGSSGVSASNSASFISGIIGGVIANPMNAELAIFSPFEATGTNVNLRGWGSNNTIWQTVHGAAALGATTSVTGFTMYITSGNMNGSIQVFGFND